MKVSDVMTREVATLAPEQTLEEAAQVLIKRGVSGVPVVNGGKVVGMLSERDLLETKVVPTPPRYLELLGGIIYLDDVGEFQRRLKKTVAVRVEEIMTRDVISLQADAPLEDAIRLVLEQGINRIPVLEDGRLVGIVTRNDILRGTVGQ